MTSLTTKLYHVKLKFHIYNCIMYDLLTPNVTSHKWSVLRKLQPWSHKFEGEMANFKHVIVANIFAFLQLLK
jgi:hypothetical protein